MPTYPWGRHQKKPGDEAPKEEISKKLSEKEAYALNKDEQVKLLKGLGVSEIPKLEKDRVIRILELQ